MLYKLIYIIPIMIFAGISGYMIETGKYAYAVMAGFVALYSLALMVVDCIDESIWEKK